MSKNPNIWHLIPGLRFFKLWLCNDLMRGLKTIGRTNRLMDKGDYYGPHQVNRGIHNHTVEFQKHFHKRMQVKKMYTSLNVQWFEK